MCRFVIFRLVFSHEFFVLCWLFIRLETVYFRVRSLLSSFDHFISFSYCRCCWRQLLPLALLYRHKRMHKIPQTDERNKSEWCRPFATFSFFFLPRAFSSSRRPFGVRRSWFFVVCLSFCDRWLNWKMKLPRALAFTLNIHSHICRSFRQSTDVKHWSIQYFLQCRIRCQSCGMRRSGV